jgi:hypothetical protein
VVEFTQTFIKTLPVLNFLYFLASRSAVADFAEVGVDTGSKRVADLLQEVLKFFPTLSIYFLLPTQHSLWVFGGFRLFALRY